MHDMWIAASALEYGLRVLTTDAHFLRVPMLATEYVDLAAGPPPSPPTRPS